MDTTGTAQRKYIYRYSKVSLAQGLEVDHAPPTITASYDKALLWTTKKTVLMRDLSTDSYYKQEYGTYLGFIGRWNRPILMVGVA